jgi:hypothetical protein
LALLRFTYECCLDCLPDREQQALTRVLRAHAQEVAQVCAQALLARPYQEEAPQLLLAVIKVEVTAVGPALLILWNSLCTAMSQSAHEASALAMLAVLTEALDCSAATLMVLGPNGEFAAQFARVGFLPFRDLIAQLCVCSAWTRGFGRPVVLQMP